MKLKLSDAVLSQVLNQTLVGSGAMSLRDCERAVPVFKRALKLTMALMELGKKIKQGE